MNCFITQLHRNFSDNLVGLRINSKGRAELWEGSFSCCAKKDFESIAKVHGMSVCNLFSRLKMINHTLDKFEDTWGCPFPFYIERNNNIVNLFVKNIREKSAKNIYRGFAFESPSTHKASPSIWLMAIASIWRFGIPAHVITLGKSPANSLIPTSANTPLVVLVDQVASFRSPQVSLDFSTIVNWCEGAMTPLWIDVHSEVSQVNDQHSLNTLKSFEQKIAKYKNSPPLSWVGADCMSRLQSVCTNFRKYC